MKKLLIDILAIMLLAGCSRQQPVPRQTVILVDMSASIEPQAEAECLDGIATFIAKLDRGDAVTIIPITGDADVQSTGRVLRFQEPLNRTAYDADLIGFSKQVHDSLQALRIQTVRNPTARTDIFGGIRMGIEELASRTKEQDRQMIIFSDFIEDDGAVNFSTDPRLAATQAAGRYAATEARTSFSQRIPSMRVHLGLLQSKDLGKLDKVRRTAIRQFWEQYFKTLGVESKYATDGVGLLANFSPK